MTATAAAPFCIASGCPDIGVHIACLTSYNAGRLHGAWIDLEKVTDKADLDEAIDWILQTSPLPSAEEWAMHDHSGLPGILSRSVWPDLDDLASFAGRLDDLGDDVKPYRLACDNQGTLLSVDAFREVYRGEYESGQDFAAQLADETGLYDPTMAQRWPLSCIDWEAAWRDLELGGDYYKERAENGNVYIFRNN